MSGGSWDYLCYKDADEIFQYEDLLEKMVDRLSREGFEDVARETHELVCIMRQYRVRANTIINRLSPVWRAVEWNDSGDSGQERIIAAINEYRSS